MTGNTFSLLVSLLHVVVERDGVRFEKRESRLILVTFVSPNAFYVLHGRLKVGVVSRIAIR